MSYLTRLTKQGGLFGGPPKAPDPYKLAAQQADINRDTMSYGANINAVNQFSPYGSTTFTRNKAGVPTAQTVKLSPAMQRQFDATNATRQSLLDTAKGAAATPWKMPDTARADEVAKTMYARKWGMVAPEFERQQGALNTMMADRGMPIGSEAWNSEQGRLGQERENAQTSLSQDAMLASGAEEDRLLRASLAERAQPFNELTGFAGGTPISIPGFAPTSPQSGTSPNLAGMVNDQYTSQMDQYSKGQSDFWNGLLGVGKSVLPTNWFGGGS
jgi:hypothetical protein